MEREYVGIDFHRRESVVVRISPAGQRLSVVRIDNSPAALADAATAAGDHPHVVIEATYGWYWAVDVLQELGATVQIVVEPRGRRWARQKNGTSRAASLHDTQAEAEAAARAQAKRERTELVVKGRDGKIQRRDSCGNDPRTAWADGPGGRSRTPTRRGSKELCPQPPGRGVIRSVWPVVGSHARTGRTGDGDELAGLGGEADRNPTPRRWTPSLKRVAVIDPSATCEENETPTVSLWRSGSPRRSSRGPSPPAAGRRGMGE